MGQLLAAGLPGQGSRFREQRVVLKGVLLKRGRLNLAHKGRLFVLTADGGLHYLASKSGQLAPGDKVHPYECTLKRTIPIGARSSVRDGGAHGGLHLVYVDALPAPGARAERRFVLATRDREDHAMWLSVLLRVQAMGLVPPTPPTEDGGPPRTDGGEPPADSDSEPPDADSEDPRWL